VRRTRCQAPIRIPPVLNLKTAKALGAEALRARSSSRR